MDALPQADSPFARAAYVTAYVTLEPLAPPTVFLALGTGAAEMRVSGCYRGALRQTGCGDMPHAAFALTRSVPWSAISHVCIERMPVVFHLTAIGGGLGGELPWQTGHGRQRARVEEWVPGLRAPIGADL